MNRKAILQRLKAMEPQLRKQGVCGLSLFGSLARGESSDDSDVDLLFEISPNSWFSLFDQAHISRQLSEALNTKVDFILRRTLHPMLCPRVEAEQITVFG
jgi:uncharacterized protein